MINFFRLMLMMGMFCGISSIAIAEEIKIDDMELRKTLTDCIEKLDFKGIQETFNTSDLSKREIKYELIRAGYAVASAREACLKELKSLSKVDLEKVSNHSFLYFLCLSGSCAFFLKGVVSAFLKTPSFSEMLSQFKENKKCFLIALGFFLAAIAIDGSKYAKHRSKQYALVQRIADYEKLIKLFETGFHKILAEDNKREGIT